MVNPLERTVTKISPLSQGSHHGGRLRFDIFLESDSYTRCEPTKVSNMPHFYCSTEVYSLSRKPYTTLKSIYHQKTTAVDVKLTIAHTVG